MRITADTNVLLRLVVGDDEHQSAVARDLCDRAEVVAISNQTFAELVWVLRRSYGVSPEHAAEAVRQISETQKVACDRVAVATGLACSEAGGDFADGLVAHEGEWLGAGTFASFDRAAVKALARMGRDTLLLS